ncbi:hypothetical protein HPP92_027350 [Vanilla planifolia]|uniref:NPH3 domain-containing protein n=1 Tax=Vanilla planifolia TaxID=51239 RepID=A0A835PFE9_VANPL|nr:hypothetical protein HPP92_027350 [Vanilla planifolia]
MILHASPACRENLEKRVGAQLDEALLDDLLIPNLGYTVENLYDVDCVHRMLDHFMLSNQVAITASPDIIDETQLMDTVPSSTPYDHGGKAYGWIPFRALAALIPEYARPLDDGIYRAIDIYLKAHPWLTDSEREQLCRLMNCQKLSLEACTHAAQNERLPLRVVVQVLFFEQLRLRTSVAGWLFVSDDMGNTNAANGGLILANNTREITEEIIQEEPADGGTPMGMLDMKQRVAELENECLSMKQEIEKLGKPKLSWSVICKKLPKLGFGSRSQYHSS